MRASGDSEYVFATVTLPSPVGLDFKLGSLNLVISTELQSGRFKADDKPWAELWPGLFYAERKRHQHALLTGLSKADSA